MSEHHSAIDREETANGEGVNKCRTECSGQNRSGKRCGAWAVSGATLCALHSNPERAAELGSKHGRRVTFLSRPDPLDPLYRPLKSAEEVCALLEETINRIHQGPFDLRAANAIGFLAGILLKALDQRVDAPESTDREASPRIYMNLFERLGSAAPQEKIFELFPQTSVQDETSILTPLPAPGESLDEPPPPQRTRVITVEIG